MTAATMRTTHLAPAPLRKLQQSLARELESAQARPRKATAAGGREATRSAPQQRISLAGALVHERRGAGTLIGRDHDALHAPGGSQVDPGDAAVDTRWMDDVQAEAGKNAIFETLALQGQVIENLQRDIVRLKAHVPEDVTVEMTKHGALSLQGPVPIPKVKPSVQAQCSQNTSIPDSRRTLSSRQDVSP